MEVNTSLIVLILCYTFIRIQINDSLKNVCIILKKLMIQSTFLLRDVLFNERVYVVLQLITLDKAT